MRQDFTFQTNFIRVKRKYSIFVCIIKLKLPPSPTPFERPSYLLQLSDVESYRPRINQWTVLQPMSQLFQQHLLHTYLWHKKIKVLSHEITDSPRIKQHLGKCTWSYLHKTRMVTCQKFCQLLGTVLLGNNFTCLEPAWVKDPSTEFDFPPGNRME